VVAAAGAEGEEGATEKAYERQIMEGLAKVSGPRGCVLSSGVNAS
jgi:hypothetical protein